MDKDSRIIHILRAGGIGVMATDTLYGLVGSAFSNEAVKRLYRAKGRDEGKPFIILISSASDLERFGIRLNEQEKTILHSVWPGTVSVILPCPDSRFGYLHRGTGTLAFRLPNDDGLRAFLREAGPLAAPSANPQGKKPAETILDAEMYFGNEADFYRDGGKKEGLASTVIEMRDGKIHVLRQGAADVSFLDGK